MMRTLVLRKFASTLLLWLLCLCPALAADGFRLHEQHPTFSSAERQGYFLTYDYDGRDGEAWLMVAARNREGTVLSYSPNRAAVPLQRGKRQRADIIVLRPGTDQAVRTELLSLSIVSVKGTSHHQSIVLPIDWPAVEQESDPSTAQRRRLQTEWRNDAATCWISADFGCLDMAYAQWRSGAAVNAYGMSQLDSFVVTLTQLLADSNTAVAETRLVLWRKQAPSSTAASLTEALFYRQQAEKLLGSRKHPNPDPLAHTLFTEKQKRARSALLRTPDKQRSPAWQALMLENMADLGAPAAQLESAFNEMRQRSPAYLPIYLAMANTASDTSLPVIASLAHDAVGDAGYAAFWLRLASTHPSVFDDFPGTINWAWMRQGLIETAQAYPRPARLNQAAIWACRARDLDMYAEFRKPLTQHYRPELWPHNQSIDLCDHRFP